MNFDPNPLFFTMAQIFQDNYSEDNKVIICNEGGTRSSKTWDAFHLIVAFCNHNKNQWNEIYILRDTLTHCRDFTLKEFIKCLTVIGIFQPHKLKAVGQKPYYELYGNHIYFRGLEDEGNAEGYPSDVLFVNEALETTKSKVDGLKMRCRKMLIMDWNPKFTAHWCFDLEGQPNVFFTRSNYTNNKHLKKSIINDIKAYEPWESGSYEIVDHKVFYKGVPVTDKNQPPPHQVNLENRTIDAYRWKVYGLGLRGAMEGLIFSNTIFIDKFPDVGYSYGLDFGFTNDPTALTRCAEDEHSIWIELLSYQPIETPEEIDGFMNAIGIEKNIPITADSSDKYTGENKGTVEMVVSLEEMGWEISKVSKTQSVMFWLLSMKNKQIYIVKNNLIEQARIEQENYIWKTINDIAINQPIDKFNHMWDSARYRHMAYNDEPNSRIIW